ncbi:MAG: aa3-type cytochrome c oxidase subunit IV [Proteobacteria bacterium]|nr:aa3-type cytochrome c oxidase subunit IV [Pseudomonadota bacterium]
MAADNSTEYRAHLATYTAFSKLVTFMILWIVLLLSTMALGLVGGVHILSLLLGIGGTIVLVIAFAILG